MPGLAYPNDLGGDMLRQEHARRDARVKAGAFQTPEWRRQVDQVALRAAEEAERTGSYRPMEQTLKAFREVLGHPARSKEDREVLESARTMLGHQGGDVARIRALVESRPGARPVQGLCANCRATQFLSGDEAKEVNNLLTVGSESADWASRYASTAHKIAERDPALRGIATEFQAAHHQARNASAALTLAAQVGTVGHPTVPREGVRAMGKIAWEEAENALASLDRGLAELEKLSAQGFQAEGLAEARQSAKDAVEYSRRTVSQTKEAVEAAARRQD